MTDHVTIGAMVASALAMAAEAMLKGAVGEAVKDAYKWTPRGSNSPLPRLLCVGIEWASSRIGDGNPARAAVGQGSAKRCAI